MAVAVVQGPAAVVGVVSWILMCVVALVVLTRVVVKFAITRSFGVEDIWILLAMVGLSHYCFLARAYVEEHILSLSASVKPLQRPLQSMLVSESTCLH